MICWALKTQTHLARDVSMAFKVFHSKCANKWIRNYQEILQFFYNSKLTRQKNKETVRYQEHSVTDHPGYCIGSKLAAKIRSNHRLVKWHWFLLTDKKYKKRARGFLK